MIRTLNNVVVSTVSKANDTVGIIHDGEKINILVPQVFRFEENEKILKHDLLLFLRSISIAKKINYKNINKFEDDGNLWPIDSYLWIIRDYLENGFFYNREKKYSSDRNGKIDWKRTLKTIPIISKGNVIYNNIITSKMAASNDIVAQIYRICLKQSQNRIGWLFDYNFRVDVQQVTSLKEMIYVVDQELKSTFDDIKRLRFKHMLAILKSVGNENAISNIFSYTIDNYYYVYEKMVDMFFHGIKGEQKKDYYPFGFWKLNRQSEISSSELRPDTVYIKDGYTFIIDAKMYQYGYTHNVADLPGTSSMQKQVTYGDYVKNCIDSNTEVRNIFMLPYNKKLKRFKEDKDLEIIDNGKRNLAFIGEAYVKWQGQNSRVGHEKISAFLIDFNYLLNSYFSVDTEYIDLLFNTLTHNSQIS